MRSDSVGFFWDDTPPPKPPKAEKEKRTPPEAVWLRDDYLPGLEAARRFDVELMSDFELVQCAAPGEVLTFDIESYWNYFLIAFRSKRTRKVTYIESFADQPCDTQRLMWILSNCCIVGFNSNNYDIPIATLAAAGHTPESLKYATNKIIQEGVRPSDLLRSYKVKKLQNINHIDIMEVAPLRASLKIYGGRLHAKRMQDLPFHHEAMLSPDQIQILRWYCINDLVTTELLADGLKGQMELRTQMSIEYGMDLRSKSDAQIAEAVIGQELERITGRRPLPPKIEEGTAYCYQVPSFIRYQSGLMNWALEVVRNARFIVSEFGGVGMPPELANLEIKIADGVYRMGIGGLHSSEKSVAHVEDDYYILRDRDVTSYYPKIILNQGLFPPHLGPAFLRVYHQIVERRLHAKRQASIAEKAGDKVQEAYWKGIAESLKITINGSFGKLGSMFSILYSPALLIQVTITGQLSLLMLIERFEMAGITVASANTDGIVIKCPRHLEQLMLDIVKQWELETGFETEETIYKALFSRDVNNYIAIKPDGTTKTKGAYANPWSKDKNKEPWLHKNPTGTIIVESIEALLTKGVPIETTIRSCKDIRKFCFVRTVKGGAAKVWDYQPAPPHNSERELVEMAGFYEVEGGYWRHNTAHGEMTVVTLDVAYTISTNWLSVPKRIDYLGKNIRWYYAENVTGDFVIATSGNKVPKSDGAKPLMELPTEIPDDIDHGWYEKEAYKSLREIGYAN